MTKSPKIAAHRQSGGARYYPQLDSLRTVAIFFVLFAHWLNPLAEATGIHGSYGVWLFFTLSGYLITGILLDYRKKIGSGDASMGQALKVFYARRSLRIFPAYFLFLFIAFLFGRLTYENGLWHIFYLSNFYFWKEGGFAEMGHLWSLSVEEQFYLIWPTVIIALARLRLPIALVVLIVSAVVFRLVSEMAGWGLAAYVFPIAAFDTLGLGALLAWSQRSGETWVPATLKPLRIAAVIILPFIGFAPEHVFAILAPLVLGLVATWLIELCVSGMTGAAGKVAEFPPLIYMGRISYGLYLYHGLASWIITDLVRENLLPSYTLNLLLVASLKFLILMIIASASWYIFEAPINRYKRLFRMDDQGPAGKRPRRRGKPEFTDTI
jgi:peptidoglycan/LPS O-acetylase OafA/YrhL